MRRLAETLFHWLAAGGSTAGEIVIRSTESGYELCHRDDMARGDLDTRTGAEAARELAQFDDAGKFRPLKTAPNLRHGWRITLTSDDELRRALDYFYPAMLGVWRSYANGTLPVTSLRETLGRQTGMYRVTQKITDEQARAMITGFCAGCLKRRLWTIDGAAPPVSPTATPALPLLCQEACNLLVAEARKVVKTTNGE